MDDDNLYSNLADICTKFYDLSINAPPLDNIPPSSPGIPDLITDSGISNTDNITNNTSLTFSWTLSTDNTNGSGVAGYQWCVDQQQWSSWQTSINATINNVSDGNHTFYVRAKDNAGNIGAASQISRALPAGTPSRTSTITTSASSFSTMRKAVVAPTLPAPTTVTFFLMLPLLSS